MTDLEKFLSECEESNKNDTEQGYFSYVQKRKLLAMVRMLSKHISDSIQEKLDKIARGEE